MREFGRQRPEYIRRHLMGKFETGKAVQLSLACTEGGQVRLNHYVDIKPGERFSGIYFEKVPVHIEAEPLLGYQFSHWEGIDAAPGVRELTLNLLNPQSSLKAIFVKVEHPVAGRLMFNEISCNNKKTGDWIELYNHSDQTVNLTDWILADNKNRFRLPEIVLSPKDYAILAQDAAKFIAAHPTVPNVYGDLGFGLSKRKERLSLYDDQGASVDRLFYEITPRDSAYTLNLLLPGLDNGDLENWEAIEGYGSPSRPNPYYLESRIQAQQEVWMRVGLSLAVALLLGLLLYMKRRQDQKLA